MVMALEGPMGAVQSFQAGEAQNALNQMQAQGAQFRLQEAQRQQAQQIRMQQLARGIEYGSDMAENQRKLANAFAQNGFFGEASELWKGAETVDDKVAKAKGVAALEVTRQAQAKERITDAWLKAAPLIVDQASLDAVNLSLTEQGLVSPFGQQYNPARITQIMNQVAASKGRDTEEIRLAKAGEAEARARAAEDSRAFRDRLAKDREDREREKFEYEKKIKGFEAAGKAPGKADINEATAFLNSQSIIEQSDISEVDKGNAARKLLDVANRLFKSNPGIHSREEAMEVAFTQEILPKLVKQEGFFSKNIPGVKPGLKYRMPGQKIDAPSDAVEYLRKNPALKDAFRAKYGYLPEGM